MNELWENLKKEIEAKLEQIKQVEDRDRHLDKVQFALTEQQHKNMKAQEDLDKQKKELESTRVFLTQEAERIRLKEIVDQKLEAKKVALAEEDKRIQLENAKLEDKRKEFEGLEERQKALDEQEEANKKGALANLVRQQALDIEEDKIKKEQKRLQGIAENMQITS